MSFVNTHQAPYILFFIILFCLTLLIANKRYFVWIKTYWSYERTLPSYISSILYTLSISIILISLLDLRGPEERIKSSFPDQRTIIIIDSSTSMLAEDVRPSRFSKAIQMARHLVKNAAAHQVSIVLFSDVQKRLIPFTDDIDLLDSRLAALEKTNSVSGGSNISQAVAEAVGYFDFEDNKDQAVGNIVVFTDAEESEGEFDLDLGSNINLAIVGIGTINGSNIPLRWEDGTFRGFKSQKGQPVITKLDENYIKKIGKKVKNYKYWIANSYSLPTDEILNFFRNSYNKKQGKGDVRVRPVYSYLLLIPAIILYCFSVIIGRLKTFKVLSSIIWLFIIIIPYGFASEGVKTKVKEIPKALQADLEKMKAGKNTRLEVLKIAERFLKNDDPERAIEIYKEYSKDQDDENIIFNRATANLKAGKLDEAMPDIQNLYSNSKNENLKNKLRNNVLLALNSKSGGKSNKESKDDKSEDKKDDKNDNKKENENKNDDKKDDKSKDKNKDQQSKKNDDTDNKKNESQKPNPKDGESDNNKDKKPDEKKDSDKDPKDLEKPEKPEVGPKSREEKEKMIEQQRKLVKTPAMIKQILSDDRELQKRMMDTSTNERSNQKPKRDW